MNFQRPSGTVTFLFTDIEGSTLLWERKPHAMQINHARHEAILRSIFAEYGGYAYKMIGDAFQVAFATAPAALAAAVAAQRALQSEAWGEAVIKVRMALHTGVTEERGDDYVGPLLNRVARLMGASHGGQVLLTQVTYNLVVDDLPDGVSLRDLGERRLKDLVRPERVYQAEIYGSQQEFAPLKTLDIRPNNLPVQTTSFIGRETQIKAVKDLLDRSHLVTLTGPGGTGKTRLSLQVGAELVDEFEHGVWFVELAPLADARLVAQAAASVLGIKDESGGAVLDALARYVRDKELLIILDNCEHLVQASAELARLLTQSGANVKLLASSREQLHVAGESIYPVPSLSIPDPRNKITIITLTQFEAASLFIDRAIAVQPAFQVTNHNAPAVADICHRLDGIPLALELAAARVRVLSVEKIAERLNDRFRLLTSGNKAALPHQQTLRALIDWSYDLLSEPERALLRRLAVFAGGWTLEAAEAVGAGGQVEVWEVLDLLANLVEKSLVSYNSDAARYSMLETLRQYAAEKLAESAETETYRQIHCEHFLRLAEDGEWQLTGTEQAKWLDCLEVEHDNLRTAIEWALNTARAETAHRLCGALGRFWWVHGHMTEGRAWLRQALARREGVSKEAQAKALRWAGGLAWPQGDLEAARAAFSESMALYSDLGDKNGMAVVLGNLGTVAQNQGDCMEARALFEQSLAILRQLGNKWGMANVLNNLGNVAQEEGDYASAQELHEESLALRRELGDQRGMGIALNNLGSLALEGKDLEKGRAYFEESLKNNYEIGARMMLAYNFSGLAQVFSGEGQFRIAAQLIGATDALLEELGAPLESYEQGLYDKTNQALKESLGAGAYQQAFEAGKAMPLEQAVQMAIKKA